MTVSELAKQSGATPDAVRYYTRMGLLNRNETRRMVIASINPVK
jgi:DNA-binding transcriptional MerR regulator